MSDIKTPDLVEMLEIVRDAKNEIESLQSQVKGLERTKSFLIDMCDIYIPVIAENIKTDIGRESCNQLRLKCLAMIDRLKK